jgi:Xaa-Pro aminopeptidase
MSKLNVYGLFLSLLFICTVSLAQDKIPDDYLSKDFHAGRREALREIMPANSVAAVFAYPTRTFSNDVEYVYHQNPDLYYFTGYKEPNSMLLIFKEEQQAADGSRYKELFFIQKKNALAEQWTGVRLGTEGVKQKLGINAAYNGDEFKNFNIDFSKFEKVLFDRFPADIEDSRDKADSVRPDTPVQRKARPPSGFFKGQEV